MAHRWIAKHKLLVFVPLVLVLIVAVACGEDATPQPPTDTPVPPTITPVPQPTPTATSVPVAPEATATSVSAVPRATATPAPTAIPQPTPTPEVPLVMGKRGGIPPLQMGAGASFDNIYENCPSNSCLTVLAPLYNGLIESNPETDDQSDIRGDLAKRWELSSDGLSYTFFLHENARWHDGVPVTAADVVFSLDDMVNPDEPRPLVGVIKPFYDGSQAIDDHTVRVNTKFPAAPFFPILANENMKILPKHHIETGVDLKQEKNHVGSGPYKLKKHEVDISVEFTRNPDYFKDGRPYWDGMKYFSIIPHATVFSAFRSGQVLGHIHPTNNLSGTDNEKLGEVTEGKGTMHFAGPVAILWTQINHNKEPYTDVRVRRALHLAIHRQPFIQIFSRGRDTLGGPFPPGFWFGLSTEELSKLPGYRETPDGKKHPDDIAEAKRLLAEAGFPDGFKTTINALQLAEFVEMSEVLSDQLKRFLNIDATVRPLEYGVGIEAIVGCTYDMNTAGYSQKIMEPHDILGAAYVKGGSGNRCNWSHPRIEEIFELQARELDQEKRKALIMEATNILLNEDIAIINLYWTFRGMFMNNKIKNFHVPVGLTDQLKAEHLWCDPSC